MHWTLGRLQGIFLLSLSTILLVTSTLAQTPTLERLQAEARNGNVESQFALAMAYEKGKGVARDLEQSMFWLQKAAEGGHIDAQVFFALALEDGRGIPKDLPRAASWFSKAAERGDSMAQLSLAMMYEEGKGVPRDYYIAAKWYKRAAAQGEGSAQNNLGNLYRKGWGVTQDYQEAYKWFSLAYLTASAPDADPIEKKKLKPVAEGNLKITAEKLSADQIASVTKAVKAWQPRLETVSPPQSK